MTDTTHDDLMIRDEAFGIDDNNFNERVPCVVVVDGSSSMTERGKIEQLNKGLKIFEETLKADEQCRFSAQVLIIRFGRVDNTDGTEILTNWCEADDFTAPTVTALGMTPLGAAMQAALDKIEAQKTQLRQHGINYKRPWLFLISDGLPTDDWKPIAERCREAEANRKVSIFPIAVDPADTSVLGQFSSARSAVKLDGVKFEAFFQWLSASLSSVSQSSPGDNVALPSINSWASVEV